MRADINGEHTCCKQKAADARWLPATYWDANFSKMKTTSDFVRVFTGLLLLSFPVSGLIVHQSVDNASYSN